MDSQDLRRDAQSRIREVQDRVKEIHADLQKTHRGEDFYLTLVTQVRDPLDLRNETFKPSSIVDIGAPDSEGGAPVVGRIPGAREEGTRMLLLAVSRCQGLT